MTSSRKEISVWGVLFWLAMAALFAFLLAACTQATDANIPTASPRQETTQTEANPAAVESEETSTNSVTADESQEMVAGEPEDAALAFARCIRENGVPDFPDPGTEGIMITRGQVNFNDPKYQAAMEACQDLRPAGTGGGMGMGGMQGGMDEETQLAFARCMRENGVPDFPDPSAGSGAAGGRVIIGQGQGAGGSINPNDPRFQSAVQICQETILEGAQ